MTQPPHEELLEELRPVAFAIAYRMLGSVAEAEDVVQEALLRLHGALADGQRIESPRAYLATVTTRLAIDELRSARVRREHYVGDWLPEPILTEPAADDPARHAEMADSLSTAMLVLFESLSPEQRAVLLLRDVFDYGYGEIAEIVGKSEDNVRQLATPSAPARRGAAARGSTSRASSARTLAQRFLDAAQGGDLDALESLLAHDVVLRGRRRRQGAGARARAARPQSRRPGADQLDARRGADRGSIDPCRSRSTGSRARCCSTARSG